MTGHDSAESPSSRLRYAAAWCALHRSSDPRAALRHELTKPARQFVEIVDQKVNVAGVQEARQILNDVHKNRLLRLTGMRPSDAHTDAGRLAAFIPALTLSDGSAEDMSHGFFDGHNQPPWDTWVDCTCSKIFPSHYEVICWVPSQFVSIAELGVSAMPDPHFSWLPLGFLWAQDH